MAVANLRGLFKTNILQMAVVFRYISSTYNDDDVDAHKRCSAPLSVSPTHSHHNGSATPAAVLHAGSAFEGRITYDPRDLTQEATDEAKLGGKMLRSTLMEEVLLLGVKDKHVCVFLSSHGL
jgi:Golgi phosphoprotein 3